MCPLGTALETELNSQQVIRVWEENIFSYELPDFSLCKACFSWYAEHNQNPLNTLSFKWKHVVE